MADTEFVRVKDTLTGAEFTAHADSVYAANKDRFTVLRKADALGVDGLPLPPVHPAPEPTETVEEASK